VLAAVDTLVVCYTGANEHTGQLRPPAVPLGELLDALDVTTAEPVRERVVVRHPLQPFDVRNFTGGPVGAARAFSFDRAALAGAQAATAARHDRVPFLSGPLGPAGLGDVGLGDLQSFLAHPIRAFMRQRLDVAVADELSELDDAIPIELDALTRWGIGDRILRQVLAGADASAVCFDELCRGELPPGEMGTRELTQIVARIQSLANATASLRTSEPRTVEVTVDLGGERRLTGAVRDVRGDRLVRVHYANLAAKHRLGSWLELLALAAAFPDRPWTAHTVGWHPTGAAQQSVISAPADPLATLRDLVDLRDRGLREPIPLPPRTAYAWADALRARKDPTWDASNVWDGGGGHSRVPPENADPFHVHAFGAKSKSGVLQGETRPDERWNGQTHRLGQYAVRLWQPRFDHEQVAQL